MNYLYGVDVSENNGNINWAQLKASGKCDFSIIRISYGTRLDIKFYTNLAAVKANNIPYAFYLYSLAGNIAEAQKEAQFALSKVAGTRPLFVAYDAECAALAAETKNQTTDIACAFLGMIHSAGFRPYLYCNRNWQLNEIDVQFCRNKGYGFWMAWYGIGTPLTTDKSSLSDIWQYSETGVLAGNGSCNIDLNCIYNQQLIQLINGAPMKSPAWIDTTMDIKIKQGATYTVASGSKAITTGNSSVIQTAGQTFANGQYETVLKAVGAIGQCAGVFLNGVKKFQATII